jgi:hypothetical protein
MPVRMLPGYLQQVVDQLLKGRLIRSPWIA